jgi:chloramphenicol-sensitive protein RarD
VSKRISNIGIILGFIAYTWWALAAFYFKALSYVSAYEILAHRIIWSAVLLVGILMVRKYSFASIRAMLNNRTIYCLILSALLLFTSWFLFVWAVVNGQLLQVSFGYFLYPIVCVILGFVFLRERFQTTQLMGIALVIIAVAVYAVGCDEVPVLALIFAFGFALYGMIHKKLGVDSIICVAFEAAILTPICIVYLWFLDHIGRLTFGNLNLSTDLLLLSAGIVTTVPLVCFVSALQRMRYASLGVMMYIMPSITFAMAVLVFDEPFDRLRLLSFVIAWIAVAIYAIPTQGKVRIPRNVV